METDIFDLDLSVRAFNIIKRLKITTIDELNTFNFEPYRNTSLPKDFPYINQGIRINDKLIAEINAVRTKPEIGLADYEIEL
tara:strand:+ start:1003 stop:1248 length:246 start_codon:yes stop_codon:yes gene_type:complete